MEGLQSVSINRAENGGLSMVVSRQVKVRERDEKTSEILVISDEKRYEVETDEWGYICSLKEQALLRSELKRGRKEASVG